MLEKVTYINHLGQILDFGDSATGLYVDQHELRNYVWGFIQYNGKIISFNKELSTKPFPVMIATIDKEKGYRLRDKLFEIVEIDVLNNKPGKIMIGDYYLNGYITENKKSDWVYDKGHIRLDLSVTLEDPNWKKDTVYSFGKSNVNDEMSLDYDYDYPYEFSRNIGMATIKNDAIAQSNFIMNIYGPCENPYIIINDHRYQVNASLRDGETLQIDSENKTIYKLNTDRTKENFIQYRYKLQRIFDMIPSGNLSVTWPGDFGFDITIKERRSEPKWKQYDSKEETKDQEIVSGLELLDNNGDFILDNENNRIEVAG